MFDVGYDQFGNFTFTVTWSGNIPTIPQCAANKIACLNETGRQSDKLRILAEIVEIWEVDNVDDDVPEHISGTRNILHFEQCRKRSERVSGSSSNST